MWLYIIGGVLLVVLAAVAYVFYKGYNKVKPKPIQGIPCPPLTHSILGHPDKMLHPLKHELRLEVTESARAPVHQLVLMNHASVFINDAVETARILNEVESKGRIYSAFRFEATVPDILACDGDAYEIRSKALSASLNNLKIVDETLITKDLLQQLRENAESGKPVDIKELFAYVGFDCVCLSAFGYELGAVQGSADGKKLYQSLRTLADVQAGQGVYPSANARKVPPEEVAAAKADWRAFLQKMVGFMQSEAQVYETANGELDVANNYAHALVKLSRTNPEHSETIMMSEIHQILRHGHECISGMLQWIVYVLFKVKKLRNKVEKALLSHSTEGSKESAYPVYLECVLKEVLRRYPVAGNMTVRTPAQEGGTLAGGFDMPANTPLHASIFTMQNSTREWHKPKEFLPERWLDETEGNAAAAPPKIATTYEYPKCPFLQRMQADDDADANFSLAKEPKIDQNSQEIYHGVGFRGDSLSFFPFSAGRRACSGKQLALQVMRKFLFDVASNYHLDPVQSFWEDDMGVSVNATIVPLSPKALTLKVRRIVSLEAVVAQGKGALVGGGGGGVGDASAAAAAAAEGGTAGAAGGEDDDEGWADDDDDEEEDEGKQSSTQQ